MSEEDARGLDVSNTDDGGLQDHIAHWVEVLDTWVKGIDQGLGKDDREGGSLNGAAGDGGSQPLIDGFDAEPAAGVGA